MRSRYLTTNMVSKMLSIVMIEHSDQNQLKRKGLCLFLLPDKSPSLRTERAGAQGRNPEAGTEAKPWRTLLTGLL